MKTLFHMINVETNLFCHYLCCFVAKSAIYAVLPWNLFRRDLRAFVWRKIYLFRNCACGEKRTSMGYGRLQHFFTFATILFVFLVFFFLIIAFLYFTFIIWYTQVVTSLSLNPQAILSPLSPIVFVFREMYFGYFVSIVVGFLYLIFGIHLL